MLHKLRFGSAGCGKPRINLSLSQSTQIRVETKASTKVTSNTGPGLGASFIGRGFPYNRYFGTYEISPPEESQLRIKIVSGSGKDKASTVNLFEVAGFGIETTGGGGAATQWASLEW